MTPEQWADKIYPCPHGLGGYDGPCDLCAVRVIREAVLAERGRCAAVAEAHRKELDEKGWQDWQTPPLVARVIAEHIREEPVEPDAVVRQVQ